MLSLLSSNESQLKEPYYNSPELFSGRKNDAKSDVWSLGCILYELCSLQPAFLATSLKDIKKKVLLGKFDPIPSHYSEELFFIVRQLLHVSPRERLSTCNSPSNLS